MVNRGGRSKGCITCKRRRVKCDETKPTCAKCAQVGYNCEGYQAFTIIVESRFARTHSPTAPPTNDDSSRNHSSTSTPDRSCEAVALNNAQQQSSNLPAQVRNHSAFSTIPPFIGIGAFKDDVFATFSIRYLPKPFDYEDWRGESDAMLYSPYVVAARNEDGISKVCFDALASSFFGKVHKHGQSLALGSRNYGIGLRRLHAALAEPSARASEDLVAAISLLSTYESLTNPSARAWLQHASGLTQLFKLWGPELFQSRMSLRLFTETRGTILLSFCMTRRRCFLADPAWRTVPFQKHPEARGPLQYILDVLAFLPGLMEARDDAVNVPEGPLRAMEIDKVFDRILKTINLVESWYKEWRQRRPDDISWNTPQGLTPFRDDTKNFDTDVTDDLSFKNAISGKAFMIYNCTVLLCYWLLLSLTARSWPGPRPDWPWADLSQPAVPEWARHTDRSISAILAATNYLRDPKHGSHSFLLGPLRIAFLGARGQQQERCKVLLHGLAGESRSDSQLSSHAIYSVWEMAKSMSGYGRSGSDSVPLGTPGEPWRRTVAGRSTGA